MKKKLIFPLIAVLLLTPWPVAYAYGGDTGGQLQIQVEAAAPEASPRLNAFGNAIGSVTPGDLFYIDNTNVASDMPATLHITNTDELVHRYRYLTLKVGVYIQAANGHWEKLESMPETYITLLNNAVPLTLPGYARYKITIDRGCYYCYGADPDGGAISPAFFLTTG